jgi:hypothetical protein
MDVDGPKNSEESRAGGMDLPYVRNDLCPSSPLPVGRSLSTELAGVEERRICGYESENDHSPGPLASFRVEPPHSDSPIELRASTDGLVGSVIFQGSKPSLNRFGQQISSMFNPQVKTGEFGLYALENPGNVYRIILAQTSATPKGAKESV